MKARYINSIKEFDKNTSWYLEDEQRKEYFHVVDDGGGGGVGVLLWFDISAIETINISTHTLPARLAAGSPWSPPPPPLRTKVTKVKWEMKCCSNDVLFSISRYFWSGCTYPPRPALSLLYSYPQIEINVANHSLVFLFRDKAKELLKLGQYVVFRNNFWLEV